jgi:hypothetical protein
MRANGPGKLGLRCPASSEEYHARVQIDDGGRGVTRARPVIGVCRSIAIRDGTTLAEIYARLAQGNGAQHVSKHKRQAQGIGPQWHHGGYNSGRHRHPENQEEITKSKATDGNCLCVAEFK